MLSGLCMEQFSRQQGLFDSAICAARLRFPAYFDGAPASPTLLPVSTPFTPLCCSEHHKAQQQRQRQAAAEARLAEQEAESAARQRKAARGDAVSAYKTLLAEVVRDAGASFQAWQPKLAKDPLVRCRLSAAAVAALLLM